MDDKLLIEVIRAQQETIRILQENIKILTRPSLVMDFPPISLSEELKEE